MEEVVFEPTVPLADTQVFKPSRVSLIAIGLSGLVKHNCQNYANLDFVLDIPVIWDTI